MKCPFTLSTMKSIELATSGSRFSLGKFIMICRLSKNAGNIQNLHQIEVYSQCQISIVWVGGSVVGWLSTRDLVSTTSYKSPVHTHTHTHTHTRGGQTDSLQYNVCGIEYLHNKWSQKKRTRYFEFFNNGNTLPAPKSHLPTVLAQFKPLRRGQPLYKWHHCLSQQY